MAKQARTKPALTVDQHKALGAELHAIFTRLCAIGDDLGARYPRKVRDTAARTADGITALAHVLDDVLWREAAGVLDRATLSAVYFPDLPGSRADAEPAAPCGGVVGSTLPLGASKP